MKIAHVKITEKEKMNAVKEIRMQVFVIEQNVPSNEDWDKEPSENYLIYNDQNLPIGTMRWREAEGKIKIERVSVLKEYRNQGYGEQLMKFVLEDIKRLNITKKQIILHSQLLAIPLYERLGFVKYGEIFYEAEIPHYAMRLV
ncbi:MAG: GNAT family N-acetyltransferase [Bacteroidales bacterium]